jgi:methylphosphotriester-DNA--protein-cysteine methyltransferase
LSRSSGVYVLIGRDGRRHASRRKGRFGGHRKTKIYGRLDCRAALAAIARGGYVRQRVFFASAADARAAGYRPCAVCLPAAYAKWKLRSRRAG